jgi:hypothetical protein
LTPFCDLKTGIDAIVISFALVFELTVHKRSLFERDDSTIDESRVSTQVTLFVRLKAHTGFERRYAKKKARMLTETRFFRARGFPFLACEGEPRDRAVRAAFYDARVKPFFKKPT